MYYKRKQFSEALQALSVVLDNPEIRDPNVFMARGKVYQEMGNHQIDIKVFVQNHQLAIKDFNQAVEINPKLVKGLFKRGMSKLAIKNYNGAIEDLKLA